MKLRSGFTNSAKTILLAAAFLAGAVLAQTPSNVSTYPDPSLLPGKGPTNVWSGLAPIWSEQHKKWAPHMTQDHHAVVFLGDSITQGWNSLSNDFSSLHVANRGIGGDTTRGVLYRLQGDVLDLDPKAIVLLIGTNDLGIGADPGDVIANIKEIIARIKAFNPHIPIIVCKVMPRSDGRVQREHAIQTLNSLIEAAVKDDPQCTLCDTWSPFADAAGNCSPSEFPDRLHPNAAGYAKWTAALQPLLAQLKLTTTTHPVQP